MSQIEARRLTPFSRRVLAHHPVRKTRAQKAAFRAEATEMLEGFGWGVHTQQAGGLVQSCNLIAGDVAKARVIFTAHYDTPARMPVPNFMAPRNLALTLLYQLALGLLLLAVPFAIAFGLLLLTGWFWLFISVYLLLVVLAMWLLLAGPANPSNANDNTSGVLSLCEIAAAMPPELQAHTALVFFDNEEKGLLGSYAFMKQYGTLTGKLLVNFDCVGVGDTLLLVPGAKLRKSEKAAALLRQSFGGGEKLRVLVDGKPTTMYPSDQMWFGTGVGVAALRQSPLLGLHLSRLHTARDTVLEQQNILDVCAGAQRLAEGQSEGQFLVGSL